MLEQCFSVHRKLDEQGKEHFEEQQTMNSKALQLIRFLAQKGVDHG